VVSRLPLTASGAVSSRLVDTVGKAQLASVVLRLRSLDPATVADRSAAAWLRDLGLRPRAAAIMRTLAHVASYADDLEAISADAVAAQLQSAVSDGVRYLDGGWQVLVDGLRAAATRAGAELRTGTPIVGVEAHVDGGVAVHVGGSATIHGAAAVLAVGGPAAVASLLREPPRWGLIGPPATVACLDLGLCRPPRKRVLFGVGEPLYFSTHTPSAALAPPGRWVAHVMRYGARDADTDRADLWAHARVAGVDEDDVVEHRFLARMVVTHAVPVPGLGLAGRPRVDAPGAPGVYVAGDWVGPDGLLADATLASGAAAGQRAASHAHHELGVR
jgi:phytoene dehydrogenase-like protein